MTQWKELHAESRTRWERNAGFWDDYMGEASNRFHRELIRPHTLTLLELQPGQRVLDVACGNGNFSRTLAELGAQVVAVDYSPAMIERAALRTPDSESIAYQVVDATDREALLRLGAAGTFDRAVANMALMDIADIQPLAQAAFALLKPGGAFVFSIVHPCFQTPNMRKIQETEDANGEIVTRTGIQTFEYLTASPYEAIGIRGQPVPHYMFHRPLAYYIELFVRAGFALDGFKEPSFARTAGDDRWEWVELPPVAIFRFRK